MRNRIDASNNEKSDDEWVKLDSPKAQSELRDIDESSGSINGTGIKMTASLESMVERTDITPKDMKRGRDILLQKRISQETNGALERQAAKKKAEWQTIYNYIYYGAFFLLAVYIFFRFGPTLKKPSSPGTNNNPALQEMKRQAADQYGEPLADILIPGLRL
jgi:hypothetical protein